MNPMCAAFLPLRVAASFNRTLHPTPTDCRQCGQHSRFWCPIASQCLGPGGSRMVRPEVSNAIGQGDATHQELAEAIRRFMGDGWRDELSGSPDHAGQDVVSVL
jgi:hypothetical protein